MVNQALKTARGDVETALGLLDSETADEIIGEESAEHKALIRGTQGVYQMLWSMALGNGMRKRKATLKMGAQALTILLTLVHYAYALGVKAGREAGEKDNPGFPLSRE